jgi:hypothetical protein
MSLGEQMKQVEVVADAVKGAHAFAYRGTSDQWLVSLKDLDAYAERLSAQLAGTPAPAPA